VQRDTVDYVAKRMLDQPQGLALVRFVSGCGWAGTDDALRDHLFELRKKGFNRLYQNAKVFRILHARVACSIIDFSQPLFILVDRFVISPESAPAHRRHHGDLLSRSRRVIFETPRPQSPPPVTLRFSEKFACKRCGIELVTPEPGLFSFNNPMGRLPALPRFREIPSTTIWTW